MTSRHPAVIILGALGVLAIVGVTYTMYGLPMTAALVVLLVVAAIAEFRH
ncbi:hypothetical protein [Rhodococcus sp. RDE2]|nr:hypothetical protein [Rhodococcus sp. RDE2]